ncbi:uncharacterized protein YdeI (BOF family) [Neobacillus niacini]|uniref:DUF4350 domain-containing protein n=1 Tax=Neobacillus driksii TaxID=3035913 RepID=UPI00278194C1|nr:DUF4350 domain-containing protein [Neobacillus niacini]MDQ0975091.1 uncharacterized protein YdeI (BOF family) [Neobacillus niacini]
MNFSKGKEFKRWTSTFIVFLLLVSTFLPSGLMGKANAKMAEHVVISQVFGGGGNSGAPYKQDFVELYNPTDQPIEMVNWQIQYTSSTGTFSSTSNAAAINKTIPAHGYLLIVLSAGAGAVTDITALADMTAGINMSGTNGKVRIVDADKNVVDLVGFGSANEFEGTKGTNTLSNSTSAQRRPYSKVDPAPGKGNAWDSDDNSLDFFVGPVTAPRNTASPTEAPMVPEVSLDPIGLNIQLKQNGTSYTVTGTAGAAVAQSTVNVYASASKGNALGTAVAAEDGSFTINFNSETALPFVYVSSIQGSMDESAGIEIKVATASKDIAVEQLSYMVDGSGKGTLIGNAGTAVANSVINVYSDANKTQSLATKEAGTKGEFNLAFEAAPTTVYVTQITSSSKGIMLESAPVAIEKAVLDNVTSINVVKETDDKGILKSLNSFFTVEGVVTVQNGVLGTQKNNYYIQDATGGINVFGSFDSGLTIQRGDKLKVTGKVIVYNGLTEFEPTAIVKVSEGNPIPAVKDITILDLNTFTVAEPLEGSLIKVSGKVSALAATGANYNVTLVDENNKSTTIRVMGTTGIKPDTDLVVGNSYAITGIVGQYTTNATHVNGYQVFPRDVKDITAMLNLSHTPLTEVFKDTNIEFVAIASGAESVTVYYRAKGANEYTALPMTSTTEGRYTATLTAGSVPANGFEYYIEAKNGEKTQTSGKSDTPLQVTLIADTFAPEFLSETPANGTRVESPRPEISVVMEDPSEVDTTTVKVWFDGTQVTNATIGKKQVKFTPEQDLNIGVHTVKVEATDSKGNKGTKEWTFESVPRFTGGQHFRGTTHNHTNISHDGAGSPEAAVAAGKKYGYDWFAFSDHSHDIDPTLLGQDTVVRDGMQERKGGSDWQLTKDLADQNTKNGEYVVFPAFEMTSTTWGHSNIFGSENFIDRNINGKQYQDLNQYYAWVMTYDDIVGQFNHPDMSNNAFNNFKPYNKEVDQLFTMLEVGNGSGHYAYANAEKKFFSVLDLGWQVAPTYGEDNHEGTWGQTMARTVIVADDLTQASLLHSMRNMRVYMVEDPNFTLDVLANGYYMGSTVDSKDLKFKISGSDLVAEDRSMSEYNYLAADYKSDDRVEKVELVTNGGVVVDSYSPMTKDFTWEPSYNVAGGQQWFVVRVTQADGERMYSAPIWSKEEAVDVRVNGIDVEGEVIFEGNPATLKASVSNNGTQSVQNVNVNLYYDEVKEANLIGTQTLSSIVSKGVGTASFTWNNTIKGDHKLIAVASSDYGTHQFTLDVSVKEPLGLKVMIDAKHNNENTSSDGGTYKDNLKAFTVLLQKEGYTVVENKETITDAVLSTVKVLVITHNRNAFTADESAAIAKFVKNGGSVLFASKSNNSTDPTINNSLLGEIGSTIRMGNDGVFDDSKEGNFWSDPKVSPFAVRVFPSLVSNYITDRVSFLDYYSGTSLSAANNQPLTDGGKVTILAKGNETTYQGNIKGGYTYDAVSDAVGGSAIPLIASEEIGENGRIIVSGMNIFNDKQIDESYEPKGNDEFSLNAINWLAGRGTKVTKIGDARKLADDSQTVIEGTVTTGAGVFFDAFYVQDETGGIMAFQEVPADSIKPGDKVRIYGHIIEFDGNKEIEFTSFNQDVIKIGSGEPLQPKEVATGEATSDANQGLLVKVKGKVVSIFDDNSYVINDGSGDVLVFTDGYIVNQSGPVPVLKVGDTLEAVGLSGTFADGTRIRVRDTKELVGTDTSIPEVPFINGVTDQDTTISGTAEVNSVVTAKVDGVEIGKATADTEGKFTIAIAVQNAGTKLLVTATDASGNVSEEAEVTVLDVTAPGAPVVNGVNDNDLSISGKAEPGAIVTAKVNGKEIGTATADAEGNFTINIAKQVAGAVIHVTAADASKNESTDAQVTVTDEVVTKVSVTSNVTGNHAFKNLHQFTAVSEGSRYAVYRFLLQDEKGNITLLQDYGVNSTVSWTPKLPGTYTIIVLAKDKYNNGFLSSYHEAETKLTFTVNPSKGK